MQKAKNGKYSLLAQLQHLSLRLANQVVRIYLSQPSYHQIVDLCMRNFFISMPMQVTSSLFFKSRITSCHGVNGTLAAGTDKFTQHEYNF